MTRRMVQPGAVGRPSLIYDARRIRKLLREIQRGTPKRQAAERVGIAAKTFDRWMQEGAHAERLVEEGLILEPWEERFRAFRALVHRAIADFEARTIYQATESAVRTDKPTILLEILRRHPDTRARWNVPQQLEVIGDQDEAGISGMTDAELDERLERLERIARDRTKEGIET